MAFKTLVFLVIFKFTSSIPDPDTNVNVNVNVDVEENDCKGCPEWCTDPWRWVPALRQCFKFVDMSVGPGSPGVAWGVASSLCISMYPPSTQLAMPYNIQDLSVYMKSKGIRAGLPSDNWWITESNATGCDMLSWDNLSNPIITPENDCNLSLSYICEKSV